MKPLMAFRWFREISAPILLGAAAVLSWQAICHGLAIPPYVFPAPADVATSLIAGWSHLMSALANTLLVTIEAFVIAVLLGTACGFLFVQSPAAERSLFPYIVLVQVTPVVAVAPLLIILFQNVNVALVLCATLVALFPVVSNTTIGLRSVDPGLLSYFQMNKITRWQTLIRLRVPSALPFFLAGLRISSGLSLIGAVVSEFVAGAGGRSAGLAYLILQAGYQLDLPRMFAALFLITISGLGLFLFMVALERALLGDWHENYRRSEGER